MLPNTVGELREFIKGLPDEMPFNLEVDVSVDTVKLEVEDQLSGYDGKNYVYKKMLVLTVDVSC